MTVSSERAREGPRQTAVVVTREPVAADIPRVAGPEVGPPTGLRTPRVTGGRRETLAASRSPSR
eukprot:8289465-Alexandrium_andersonii.AAC.1